MHPFHRPQVLRRGTFAAAFSLLLICIAQVAAAAEPVGRVLLARGDVTATGADGAVRVLSRRDQVLEADVLETAPGSLLQVRFEDGATLELRGGSRLELSVYRYQRPDEGEDSVLLRVLSGALRAISGAIGGDDYELEMPVASIGIRGTHFEVAQETVPEGEPGSWVSGVWTGGIVVANEYGSLDLGADVEFLFARTREGEAPKGLVNAPAALKADTAGGDIDIGNRGGASDGNGGELATLPAESTFAPTDPAGLGVVAEQRVNPAESVADAEDLAALEASLFGPGDGLSERERAALASGERRGILVFDDGRVVTGPATRGDDGGQLFLIDLDDGGRALIRGGNSAVADAADQVGGFDVSWGRFAAGGPRILLDDGEQVSEGLLDSELGFLMVETAQLADLNVNAAFSGDTAFGTTSAGEITDFGVFFDAELNLGDGAIRDGHLLLEAAGGVEEYRVNFEGLVRGGEAALDVTQGVITGTGIDGSLDVDTDLSTLRGLFTGAGEGFAGGFYLQQAGDASRFARGGFVAEQVGEGAVSEAPQP